MKDILLYVHTHKPLADRPGDWQPVLANREVPGATLVPPAMPGVRLDEFDSFAHVARNRDAVHVGVCQYRRRPVFTTQHRVKPAKIYPGPVEDNAPMLTDPRQADAALDILKSHDVIQYRPFTLEVNYLEQWGIFGPPAAFRLFTDVLAGLGMGSSLGFYEHSNAHVWASLMVCRHEIFAEFTHVALNVIRILMNDSDFRELMSDPKHERVPALLLERLAPFWVFHKRLKSAHVPCVCLEPGI